MLIIPILVAWILSGCSIQKYGDEKFSLYYASHGKDVEWIPTKIDAVHEMLEAAAVGSTDIVYDLGSGDGIIPIEAARLYSVRAIGIEYNLALVKLSQRNAERARVSHLVAFRKGDIFVEDFSEATVVTLYLGENLNARLMPKLLSMEPGTRIVSNTFRMESWIPDRELRLTSGEQAYLWIVPAFVDGDWEISGPMGAVSGRLSIRQKKQFFDAVLTVKSRTKIFISDGILNGSRIRFEFVDAENKRYSFSGSVSGDQLSGYLNNDSSLSVSGRRVP